MQKPPLIASDYLQALLRPIRRAARFWAAGVATFLLVMGVTLATAVVDRQYRSEAVLHYQEGMQWTSNESMSTRRIGQRLRDVVLARAQLTKVIEELGLYPDMVNAKRMADAVEELRAATSFKVTDDIFTISYTGSSPEEAQRVTARLTDVLVDQNARLRSEQAEIARAFLDAEKKRNAAELGAIEGEQLRFLAKHPEFASEQSTIGAALRATRRGAEPQVVHLPKGDGALGALRREEERLRRQIAAPSQVPRPPKDPALLAAKSEAEAFLKNAQRELADRRARFTEQHPDVRSATAMVAEATEAYRRAVDALNAAETPEVEPRAVLEARLAQVQQEIASYQRKKRSSGADAAGPSRNDPERGAAPDEPVESSAAAQRIVALETEWARLNREVAEARDRLQQLDTRQFMASMVANTLVSGQAAQVVVVDPAYLPAHPIGMSFTRRLLMGIVMALFSGLSVAVAAFLLDNRIRDRIDVERLQLGTVLMEITKLSIDEAERALRGEAAGGDVVLRPVRSLPPGARSSGTPEGRSLAEPPAQAVARRTPAAKPVPVRGPALQKAVPENEFPDLVRVHRMVPEGALDPRLLLLGAPDSPAAASFRVLCHRIGEHKDARVLLVSSAVRGEGKTFCAANLALALSESGRARALLLEANFHRPAVAPLLGFTPPVNVSEQLDFQRNRPKQPWVVVECVTPWLHAAAVTPGTETSGPIDGHALALLGADMRRAGYDYVVVDGPAILEGADVDQIEEHVDGILLTVRAGTSSVRALRRAVDQIGSSKLLGIALLGT